MKKRKKKRETTILHSKGSFLNKPGHHSDATIQTYVAVISKTYGIDFSNSIRIRDCHHTITLATDGESREDYLNTKAKVSLIIKQLKQFVIAYDKGYKQYQKALAQFNKDHAEKKKRRKRKLAPVRNSQLLQDILDS